MLKLIGILLLLVIPISINGQYPPPPRNLSVYFVDPDYSGSTRNGTRDHPWQSLSDTLTNNPWTIINTALVKGQTTVYFSARKASSDTNQTSTTSIVTQRTGSTLLILDGHTKYNTNTSNPKWIDYHGSAKFQLTGDITASGTQTNVAIKDIILISSGNRITFTYDYTDQTISSNTCLIPDVQLAINKTALSTYNTLIPGAPSHIIVQLPSGTCSWTSGIVWTAPVNTIVKGAGNSTTGGGDITIIVDNYLANTPILDITLSSSSGSLRFTGITIRGGTGSIKDEEGVIRFIGPLATPGTIRVDHSTFDMQTYSSPGGTHMPVFANLIGVMDHFILNLYGNGGPFVYRGGISNVGDEVWAANTAFGTNDFLYFEDGIVNGGAATLDAFSIPGRFWDCSEGGKAVLRFTTLKFSSGGLVHSTGHAGNGRSCRGSETYLNHYMQAVNQSITERTPRAFVDLMGGVGLAWGNTADTNSIQSFVTFSTSRRDSVTYAQTPPPISWGYVGPAPIATGTVSVSGTSVTKTGGTNFNTNWPAGTMIYIVDAICEGVAGQEPADGPGCSIASVNSTTSITLGNGGHTGSNLTGKAYTTGSAWDGNTDFYGYPAIDQTGRGKGDLITGVFPTKINSTTGTIAWPNQALEPIRLWMNAGTPTVTAYSNLSPTLIVSDRDYYQQANGIQVSPSSPFNGTSGNGWGLRSNRPTTCTTGVAYWSTDQGGNWNHNNVGSNDGTLDVCTATNTWTNAVYTPYTYPHPLVN